MFVWRRQTACVCSCMWTRWFFSCVFYSCTWTRLAWLRRRRVKTAAYIFFKRRIRRRLLQMYKPISMFAWSVLFSCGLPASRSYLSSSLCGRPSALPDPYKNPKHSIFPSASNQFQTPPFPYPHLTLPLPPLGPIDQKTTHTHKIEKWSEKDGEQEASGSACFSIEWIPQTFRPCSFLFQESCVYMCVCVSSSYD